jgi:hypothetical protein
MNGAGPLFSLFFDKRLEEIEQIAHLIEAVPLTSEVLENVYTITNGFDYVSLHRLEWEMWKNVLNQCSLIADAAKRAVQYSFEQEGVRAHLYSNDSFQTVEGKMCFLADRLYNSPSIRKILQPTLSDNDLINGCNQLKKVIRERAKDESMWQRRCFEEQVLDQFEQMVYRLECDEIPLSKQRTFAFAMSGVDWEGCSTGLSMKIQELQLHIRSDESIAEELMGLRNQILNQFLDERYGLDPQNSEYRGHYRGVLSQSFGLGVPPLGESVWEEDMVDWNTARITGAQIGRTLAVLYMQSNYTPFFVYQTIFLKMELRLFQALEDRDDERLTLVLNELGCCSEGLERYKDYEFNSYFTGRIAFDLSMLVLKYCFDKGYLSWGWNNEIYPQLMAEAKERLSLEVRL